MEIQLAECYQTLVTDRTLVVELPLSQIQQEGVGCGLFVIANAYELAGKKIVETYRIGSALRQGEVKTLQHSDYTMWWFRDSLRIR